MIFINNTKTGIYFSHTTDTIEHSGKPTECRSTLCKIINVDGDSEIVIGQGAAHCGPRDNFNKEHGRRLALSRALDNAGWLKIDKKIAWDSYFARNSS